MLKMDQSKMHIFNKMYIIMYVFNKLFMILFISMENKLYFNLK